MAEVTVYTTDPCSFCTRTKELLKARGIEYKEVNLAKDADGRSELVARTGMMSFPQVLVGERVVGGFREIAVADNEGDLSEFLAA